jgi:hypothetical protein
MLIPRFLLFQCPPQAYLACLPAVRAALFLEDLQKAGFNLLDDQALTPRSHLRFQLRLLWAYLTHRP